MNKLWNFFQQYLNAKEDVSENRDTDTPRRIPFFRITIEPAGLVIDYFRVFAFIALWWALVMTVFSFIFRHPYMCLFSEYRLNHQCGESLALYLALHIILLFLIVCFMSHWAKVVFNKEPLTVKKIIIPQKSDFKALGVMVAFLLVNCISLLSMWLLFQRVPNSDYRIELVYFTFAGSGLLVPFIVMRFYSLLGFALCNEKMPSLKSVWKRGRKNGMRILVSLGFIFFIAVFSMIAFNGKIGLAEDKNSLYISFVVEYLYSMLILLLAAFFANHCLLQKEYLFEREKNDN